jgi:hypothetical protein
LGAQFLHGSRAEHLLTHSSVSAGSHGQHRHHTSTTIARPQDCSHLPEHSSGAAHTISPASAAAVRVEATLWLGNARNRRRELVPMHAGIEPRPGWLLDGALAGWQQRRRCGRHECVAAVALALWRRPRGGCAWDGNAFCSGVPQGTGSSACSRVAWQALHAGGAWAVLRLQRLVVCMLLLSLMLPPLPPPLVLCRCRWMKLLGGRTGSTTVRLGGHVIGPWRSMLPSSTLQSCPHGGRHGPNVYMPARFLIC